MFLLWPMGSDDMPAKRKYPSNAQRQKAYRQRCREESSEVRQASALSSLPSAHGRRRWDAMISEARSILELAHTEMESYCDKRSDVWLESERGEALTAVMESVEEAVLALEEVVL